MISFFAIFLGSSSMALAFILFLWNMFGVKPVQIELTKDCNAISRWCR
jgi:hypothetical protein